MLPGEILIKASKVNLDSSMITVESQASGSLGRINIQSREIDISNSLVTAKATDKGNAGSITLGKSNALIENLNISASEISTITESIGDGGNVQVYSSNLSLDKGAKIIASTISTGKAGDILINSDREIKVSGDGSGIFARTDTGSTGNGGSIFINPDKSQGNIILKEGGGIGVNSLGSGKSGAITLKTNNLSLRDKAFLSASTSGPGEAGRITLGTSNDFIKNINISGEQSGIFSSTSSSGLGGNILLYSKELSLDRGAKIITSASSLGKAGSITVHSDEILKVSGNNTGIFANTDTGSKGSGGSVFINPENVQGNVTIENGGGIGVNSLGSGQGGEIRLKTNGLSLNDRAFLSAETASSSGGDINLDIAGILKMRRGSSISTTAGTSASQIASGKGGDININARFIIAPPYENSDIKANAFNGEGGSVNINTEKVFGMSARSRNDLIRLLGSSDPKDLDPIKLGTSDITAISQNNPNLNGSVEVSELEVDPTRGLNAEPLRPQKPNVSEECNAQTQAKGSRVIISGRGGITPTPSDSLTGSTIWQDPTQPLATPPGRGIAASPDPQDSSLPIAQGWIKKPNGNILLIGSTSPTSQTPACHVR